MCLLKEAEKLHGRTPEECHGRWEIYGSMKISKKDQQTLQLEAFQRGGRHWEEIAQAVGSQTNPYACFVQYQRSSGGGGGGGTGGGGTGGKHEPWSEEQRQSEREWRAANQGRGRGATHGLVGVCGVTARVGHGYEAEREQDDVLILFRAGKANEAA